MKLRMLWSAIACGSCRTRVTEGGVAETHAQSRDGHGEVDSSRPWDRFRGQVAGPSGPVRATRGYVSAAGSLMIRQHSAGTRQTGTRSRANEVKRGHARHEPTHRVAAKSWSPFMESPGREAPPGYGPTRPSGLLSATSSLATTQEPTDSRTARRLGRTSSLGSSRGRSSGLREDGPEGDAGWLCVMDSTR